MKEKQFMKIQIREEKETHVAGSFIERNPCRQLRGLAEKENDA